MPSSSDKPTNTLPGNAPRPVKAKPKASQRQSVKPTPQVEKRKEAGELETTDVRERKTSSKLTATKESKAAMPHAETRARKLTPQQQIHLARAKRRRLNERLGLGLIAVVVVVVITVFTWQAIARNQENARLTSAHASATSTASIAATATENVVSPAVPPAVTGTPVTLTGGLQYYDTKIGTGDTVKVGDTITANYTGWFKSSDVKFDSSFDHSPPGPATFSLTVGSSDNPNGVIAGWVDGIPGMKVGGSRRIIIPAALAYGATGIPGQNPGDPDIIPPNSDLIFDVTIVSIVPATATPTATAG